MRILYLAALGTLAVGAETANGQTASVVPKVFIEGFRTEDSLTRQAAIELRVALATRVAPDSLCVMTTWEVDANRSTGMPDDFGGAWNWPLVREMGWAYRAQTIVDLTAAKQGDRITLQARRIRPPKTGPIVELPIVRASTLEQAVEILARRFAADSVLMRPASERQMRCAPGPKSP